MIQYNNFLMKREQSRAGSRFAECEKSRLKAKILITLALLLTAVTGAWATEETLLTTVTATGHTSYSQSPDGIVTVTLNKIDSYHYTYGWLGGGSVTVEAAQGYTITRCVFKQNPNSFPDRVLEDDLAPFTATIVPNLEGGNDVSAATSHGDAIGDDFMNGISYIEVYGTAEPPIEVTPGSSANTWTFAMPGSDVVLTPIYAKAAAFATTGTEPDVKTLLPEAAEGVIAGTDASLIAEGTGIVAFAGTSTEVTQGTLMYAVTPATVTEAPALDAANKWSATVPTAKTVADDGADVLVWYYIQGADAPEGEAATLDNTFSDTEPACLTVQVLTNKFDIQFNAANANTIEAGKATVTVGDQPATVTEGKLQGVKMGSEVKLEAKPGYKFRKVEVKKAASTPTLKDALKDGATVVITYTWQGAITTFTYTNNGGNYTGGATGYDAEYFANGMSKDGTHLTFTASNPDFSQANVSIDFDTDYNEYFANKGSAFDSFTISVNGTDITSQLTEVK